MDKLTNVARPLRGAMLCACFALAFAPVVHAGGAGDARAAADGVADGIDVRDRVGDWGADAVADVALPWPATRADIPTTSGDIYLDNLDARIRVLAARARDDARGEAMLAGLHYHRFRLRGGLDDGEAALAAADRAVAAAPDAVDSRLVRAGILMGFHRFDAARADIAAARESGADDAALAPLERELALALGDYDAARPVPCPDAGCGDESFGTLAHRAYLSHVAGDASGAATLYRAAQSAQAAQADTSPVPLAWLHVQQGAALLEAGDVAAARTFFQAAHDRLPGYTLAAEHLAETEAALGNHARARVLYEAVIEASGDPAFIAALSAVEREAGNASRADVLWAEAREAWTARLARHPLAFAGHAIDFYIEDGEPMRALELARSALAAGQRDIDSLVRLAEAAQAAGETAEACSAYREARATGLRPPALESLTLPDCTPLAGTPPL